MYKINELHHLDSMHALFALTKYKIELNHIE
jgi:hypothetical protein